MTELSNHRIHDWGFDCFTAIYVRGDNTSLLGNLVAMAIWPGLYQDRYERGNNDWHGAIDILTSSGNIPLNIPLVASTGPVLV